jgi:hypothetical protein
MEYDIKLAKTLGALALAVLWLGTPAGIRAQPSDATTVSSNTAKEAPRSSLPEEALKQAREAEHHLASNEPDKAIAILTELDKKYPGQSAISLRLAEIHDTNNQYGPALFYYRRYIHLAGSRAREMAAARVGTLELMAGVDAEAEKFANKIGEQTRPVATPTPIVERTLSAEAKDGSRIPLTSSEQLEKIHKQGYVAPAPKPIITPANTPIVIPDMRAATPSASPANPQQPAKESMPVSDASTGDSILPDSAPPSRTAALPTPNISIAPQHAPQKPDADLLLAKAFVKSESPEDVKVSTETSVKPTAISESTPQPRSTASQPPPLKLVSQSELTPPAPSKPARSEDTPTIAYTRATPTTNSPRAENFFNVTQNGGVQAQVVILNDLPTGIVTVSIIPPDDREVLSAILAPGETKTLYVRPGSYEVTANASTNDYSPITLMSTQFQYRFQGGRQYTRRVNQTNLQQLN